ncbi:DUF58 domain-containing protein [Marinobacter salinisoli]|uniref:DUF58 domain-containing protein n=1 Tax=Marinobacter salinisoli TaxID=2769486 RepID=A0ABX7MPV4_9GAMM|nr:DUF58 domain-containing protein [Marinobacter salinisoli]QSP94362.1 DUF58 domain-containing protein [Marinobacter salinisoli]
MATIDAVTHISLPDLIRLQADARALTLPSAKPARARQAGMQRSPQRGRGMAFAEVRQYQPGDDIRSIDWRVTARRQAPHTKLYEEERERPILLICDLGPTMFFASTGAYKQVRAAQITGLLAWLALWSGDQVGGIVFNGKTLSVQRPARRKKSVLRLLDTLAEQQHSPTEEPDALPPYSGNSLDHALIEARRVAHTGSRIFVISDFLSVSADTSTHLGVLVRHNAVNALRIVDPLEQRLPDHGHFAVAGPQGPVWFDAGNRRFQEAWQEKVAAHEARLEECFRTSQVATALFSTNADPATTLKPLLGPGGRIG